MLYDQAPVMTIIPTIPQVTVTPPPPSSPFHLAPPPQQHLSTPYRSHSYLPEQYGPAEGLQRFLPDSQTHEGQCVSEMSQPAQAAPSLMEKRVRFRLDPAARQVISSKDSDETAIGLPHQRNRKTKTTDLYNTADTNVHQNAHLFFANVIDSSSLQSEREPQDLRCLNPEESQNVQPAVHTKDRLKRILGKYVDTALDHTTLNTATSIRKQQDLKFDSSYFSKHSSEESKTRTCTMNDLQSNRLAVDDDRFDKSGCRGGESGGKSDSAFRPLINKTETSAESAQRPHSALPLTGEKLLLQTRRLSASSAQSRPRSSETAGRYSQRKTIPINLHLYKIATRHQRPGPSNSYLNKVSVRHQHNYRHQNRDHDLSVDGKQHEDLSVDQNCSLNAPRDAVEYDEHGDAEKTVCIYNSTDPCEQNDNDDDGDGGDLSVAEAKVNIMRVSKDDACGQKSTLNRPGGIPHKQDGCQGQRSRSAPPRNAARVVMRQSPEGDENGDKSNLTLTKGEYRRLTEQVRDVNIIIRNKFRRLSFNPSSASTNEKLHRLSPVTSPEPITLRAADLQCELRASRLPYHVRRCFPVNPDALLEPSVVQCRPLNSRPATGVQGSRCQLNVTTAAQQRPRSSPSRGLHTPQVSSLCSPDSAISDSSPVEVDNVGCANVWSLQSKDDAGCLSETDLYNDSAKEQNSGDGNLDTVSRQDLSQLVKDAQCLSVSGNNVKMSRKRDGNLDAVGTKVLPKLWRNAGCLSESGLQKNPRKKSEKKVERKDRKESKVNINDDLSTTSGVESDGDEDDDNDSNGDDNDDGDNNDNSSDSENGGFEPSLDEIRRQLPNPCSLFPLRPEQLDAFSLTEDKRDTHRFDFDDEPDTGTPPYHFKCPLPQTLHAVNLTLCAQERRNWRDFIAGDTIEIAVQDMMDRLVQLEKAQMFTVDWETKKLRGRQRRQEKASVNSNNCGIRAPSARQKDRRCCPVCLQPSCTGDCRDKRHYSSRCHKCAQLFCTGACQDSRYEQRMRYNRSSDNLDCEDKLPAPPSGMPSRGTSSFSRRPNSKLINTSMLQSRPKSCNATLSRGKGSNCNCKWDTRPASAVSTSLVVIRDYDYEPQPPATVTPHRVLSSRPKSRTGLSLGRSTKSNRKNTATESVSRKKSTKPSSSLTAVPASS